MCVRVCVCMVFRKSAINFHFNILNAKKKCINWQTDLTCTYNIPTITRSVLASARGQRFQIQTQLVWKQLGCTCHLVLITALSCHLHVLTTQPRQVTRCEVPDFRFFKVQIKTLVASYFERNNRFPLPPNTPVNLTRRFTTGAKMNVQQKRKCQLNEKFSFQASFKSKLFLL